MIEERSFGIQFFLRIEFLKKCFSSVRQQIDSLLTLVAERVEQMPRVVSQIPAAERFERLLNVFLTDRWVHSRLRTLTLPSLIEGEEIFQDSE